MNHLSRTLRIALAAGLLVGLGTTAQTAAVGPPVAAEESDAAGDAVSESELDTCLSDTNSLSVLFLIDESKSLRTEDPEGRRVTGLQAAVSGLASLRDARVDLGEPLAVHVDVLTFGTMTGRALPDRGQWAPLEDDTSGLQQQLGSLADRDDAGDTDYVTALSPGSGEGTSANDEVGALELLERAPTDSCRLLVWFTDGEMDFDVENGDKVIDWTTPPIPIVTKADTERAAAVGTELLCEAGGRVDQLRTGDIRSGAGAQLATITLGKADFSFVERMTNQDCGSLPPRPGNAVHDSENVNDLILNLRQIVLGDDHGPDGPVGACTSAEACEFDYEFELTGPIASFNLLTLAADRVTAHLIGPDGQSIELTDEGTVEMDNGVGLTIDEFQAGSGVHQVVAQLPADRNDWVGTWRVRFVAADDAAAAGLENRASIYVFGGDTTMRVRESDTVLRHGQPGAFTLEALRDGQIIAKEPTTAEETLFALSVDGESANAPEQREDGVWVVDLDVPDDSDLTSLDVDGTATTRVRLHADAPWVTLSETETEISGSLEVRPQPRHPVLDAPVTEFDSLNQNVTVATATVVADATAPESAGEVVYNGATTPSAVGFNALTGVRVLDENGSELAPDDSIELAQGDTQELTVEVTLDDPAALDLTSADLEGAVSFTTVSAIDDREFEEVEKPIGIAVRPVVETVSDTDTALGLILLAVLLPFLILWILNWFAARVDVGRGALAQIPVRFEHGALRRRSGDTTTPLAIEDDDLDIVGMPREGRARSVDLGSVDVVRHWPLNPFADVSARATAPAGRIVVGNRGSTSSGKRGRLGASLTDSWVFHTTERPRWSIGDEAERDPTELEPVDGVLTMVVPRFPEMAKRHVASCADEVSRTVAGALARHAAEPPSKQPPETPADTSNDPWPDVGPSADAPHDPFGPPSATGADGPPPDPFAAPPGPRPASAPSASAASSMTNDPPPLPF